MNLLNDSVSTNDSKSHVSLKMPESINEESSTVHYEQTTLMNDLIISVLSFDGLNGFIIGTTMPLYCE